MAELDRIQTRPARKAAPALARYSKDVFIGLAQRTRFVDPMLARAWAEIAGPELAALCRPGRMSGGARGRTLEIVVPNGAAAARVELEACDLCEKLNAFMGPGVVARISIRQAGGKKTADSPRRGESDGGLDSALGRFRALLSARRGEKP